MGEVTTRDIIVFGADHAVDKTDSKRQTIRILEHASELLSGKG